MKNNRKIINMYKKNTFKNYSMIEIESANIWMFNTLNSFHKECFVHPSIQAIYADYKQYSTYYKKTVIDKKIFLKLAHRMACVGLSSDELWDYFITTPVLDQSKPWRSNQLLMEMHYAPSPDNPIVNEKYYCELVCDSNQTISKEDHNGK